MDLCWPAGFTSCAVLCGPEFLFPLNLDLASILSYLYFNFTQKECMKPCNFLLVYPLIHAEVTVAVRRASIRTCIGPSFAVMTFLSGPLGECFCSPLTFFCSIRSRL